MKLWLLPLRGVLHPASATDRQLVAAEVNFGFFRFSVNLRDMEDILADIRQSVDTV